MAKRVENECAYCAEKYAEEKRVVGEDWKQYCSVACASAGESLSRDEMKRLLSHARAYRLPSDRFNQLGAVS
jgi:hypothetical protein